MPRERAVVALETTIVSHGMPWPENLDTALAVEAVIRAAGAVPASIAVLDGELRVGLGRADLERLAKAGDVLKLSRADLAFGLVSGRPGATTVAATMIVAKLAGIGVFATGGIGGVHRGAEQSFDISADLGETRPHRMWWWSRPGRRPSSTCRRRWRSSRRSAFPSSATDSDEFPAFWSRKSGLPAPLRLDRPAEIAELVRTRAALGLTGGMLVANPVPAADEIPADEMAAHIEAAQRDVGERAHHGQGGDAVPPRPHPEAHQRPQPRHQHCADQEQRQARGGDRAGVLLVDCCNGSSRRR